MMCTSVHGTRSSRNISSSNIVSAKLVRLKLRCDFSRLTLTSIAYAVQFLFFPPFTMSAAAAVACTARRSTMSAMVKVYRTVPEFREARKLLRKVDTDGKILPLLPDVGFVPTMGALHRGHLSLLKRARQENDVVVCSIFVNPTQFGPNEDLDRYPRQLERDCELLQEVGIEHVFAPSSVESMYSKYHVTSVDPGICFEQTEEGKSRPGHFKGVATVVTKLLNIVQPTRAYFGQKDAAQCVLIRRIVNDLNMSLDIVVGDTVREDDGLAMSSRNAYLSTSERSAAPIIYQSLLKARELFQSKECVSSCDLIDVVEQTLKTQPLVREIQYVSVDSRETMQTLTKVHHQEGAIVSLACKIGSVRLIDNIVLQ